MASPNSNLFNFLRKPGAIALSLFFALQAVLLYAVPRNEATFAVRPLDQLPAQAGAWQVAQTYAMEERVHDVLKSDDSVNRLYVNPQTGREASLFVAFFKSQRTGAAPHSPKNCLPGAGYAPVSSGTIDVPLAGQPPLTVNRYVVARTDERTLVYYWYQSAHRAVASEYAAKVWLVLDSIRYQRSDTSLVRIVVPTRPGVSLEQADETAQKFIADIYPQLIAHLPQ